MTNRTGFFANNSTLSIDKDPAAQLTYTLDWVQWLDPEDSLASVTWDAAARRNDPEPIIIVAQGMLGTQTYVELAGGQVSKTYIITAQITTANGLTDRRNFRVNIVDRTA